MLLSDIREDLVANASLLITRRILIESLIDFKTLDDRTHRRFLNNLISEAKSIKFV